jgi:hypothetical protein
MIANGKMSSRFMPKCMFCLQEKDRLTEEHVFPAALGGDLAVPDSVCDGCNHGFTKFEQPLSQELAPIRFLLKIGDRRGNIPEVFATAKTATADYEAKLKEDGTLRLKPVVTETRREDGKREFVYRYPSERQKEKLAKEAKKKGHEFELLPSGESEEAEIHFGGELEQIGSANGFRTTAKTAYVGLARVAGTGFVLSDVFTNVRNYIVAGAGTSSSRLFVNRKYMQAVQQGPHQHSLTIAARNDLHRVDAIVRLFSHLTYFVTLSDCYHGADFCNTLVYDAYRRNVDGILLAHAYAEILQTEDVGRGADTIWDNAVEVGTDFCKFLSQKRAEFLQRKQAES